MTPQIQPGADLTSHTSSEARPQYLVSPIAKTNSSLLTKGVSTSKESITMAPNPKSSKDTTEALLSQAVQSDPERDADALVKLKKACIKPLPQVFRETTVDAGLLLPVPRTKKRPPPSTLVKPPHPVTGMKRSSHKPQHPPNAHSQFQAQSHRQHKEVGTDLTAFKSRYLFQHVGWERTEYIDG